ncbi:MAG: DUF418 domain-containing protein [Pseudomonadota bacterium]
MSADPELVGRRQIANGAGAFAPTAGAERVVLLDVLRGFAVLGILLMNIQFFAMVQAAYFNPTVFGAPDALNYAVFAFGHVFADQKFMTLFTLLYGAGLVLIGERAEARELSPTWLVLKRTFWLGVFGAMHAYLIWYGDILLVYAMSTLFVLWFRRRSATTQLVVGLLLLSLGSAIYFAAGLSLENWPPADYTDALSGWAPGAAEIARETAAYQGDWLDQQADRVPHAAEFHTVVFMVWGFWRSAGLMLIGMALYRWGLLSGRWSARAYRRLLATGLLVGLPVVGFGLLQHHRRGWDFDYSFFLGIQYNYWGSIAIALGYAGMIALWCQGQRMQALRARLAAAGRMAFTNYIGQSVICSLLFYGHGLGWFGHTERWQQLLVVLSVWALALVASPWWLARFRFGPLEWLWRSLTYAKWQPLNRA